MNFQGDADKKKLAALPDFEKECILLGREKELLLLLDKIALVAEHRQKEMQKNKNV